MLSGVVHYVKAVCAEMGFIRQYPWDAPTLTENDRRYIDSLIVQQVEKLTLVIRFTQNEDLIRLYTYYAFCLAIYQYRYRRELLPNLKIVLSWMDDGLYRPLSFSVRFDDYLDQLRTNIRYRLLQEYPQEDLNLIDKLGVDEIANRYQWLIGPYSKVDTNLLRWVDVGVNTTYRLCTAKDCVTGRDVWISYLRHIFDFITDDDRWNQTFNVKSSRGLLDEFHCTV